MLEKLRKIGYRITLQGDALRLAWMGDGKPDPGMVMPLLAELKANKAEAICYLQQEERQLVFYLRQQLETHGVASFHSERLGEAVYILQDYDSQLLTLPEDCLAFTLQELENMATQTYTDAELFEVAQAKREILAAHRVWLLGKRGDEELATGIQMVLQVFPDATVLPAQQTIAELVERCKQAMAEDRKQG